MFRIYCMMCTFLYVNVSTIVVNNSFSNVPIILIVLVYARTLIASDFSKYSLNSFTLMCDNVGNIILVGKRG